MKRIRHPSDSIFTIFSIAGLMAFWYFFAPFQMGGQNAYLVIRGISMEPNFHQGDLVITRSSNEYSVGDIVAYKNGDLSGIPVIHRIIQIESGHYFFQGDNNSWVDSYYPTQKELIGKLWIYIPDFGKVINWIRSPLHLVLGIVIIGGILMVSAVKKSTKKGKRPARRHAPPINFLSGIVIVAAIISALFLVLSIFAFTRSLWQDASEISYLQTGKFSYSGLSSSGIYDNNSIQTGDPIFTNLTCQVNLNFTYNLVGDNTESVNGTYSLSILIQDPASGWKRMQQLYPETVFSENTFTVNSKMNLCYIENLVANYQSATNLKSDNFTLLILPQVSVNGKLKGQTFSDSFNPSLLLDFDESHFYLPHNDSKSNPFLISKIGSVISTAQEFNVISVIGYDFAVWQVRQYAIMGLGICLFILFITVLIFWSISSRSEDISIRMRYGDILVDVNDFKKEFESQSRIVEVASIEDLAKIADRENIFIMHHKLNLLPPIHYYLVQTEQNTYRYVAIKKVKLDDKKISVE